MATSSILNYALHFKWHWGRTVTIICRNQGGEEKSFLHHLLTFERGGNRLGGAEGVRVRKGTLASVADGLYSEVVTAGLGQPLDLVGVAGAAVDCHEPGQKAARWRRR